MYHKKCPLLSIPYPKSECGQNKKWTKVDVDPPPPPPPTNPRVAFVSVTTADLNEKFNLNFGQIFKSKKFLGYNLAKLIKS